METSIRFVRVNQRVGMKPALCFRGRKQAHVVINDDSIVRVVSNIPVDHIDKAHVVLGPIGVGTREYPISLFVERIIKIGERKGMTKRAEFMLKRALEGGIADNEPLPPDELTLPPGLQDPIKCMERGREIHRRMEATGEDFITAADRTRAPKPDKPVSRSSGAVAAGSVRTAGADVIRTIAAELKLEPTKLRKLLRSKGLSAPYTDEGKIRKAAGL